MLETFKALSDQCRIRLLAILMRGEFTVQELTAIIETGQSRISHHLKTLTEAGLLSVKRQGTWSYYSVGDTNKFFVSISEAIALQFEHMPERNADLAAVAAVFEERRKKSQEFFDRHALQWRALSQKLLPLPEYQDRLLMAVPRGARLLEIGVGTGDLLLKLAEIATVIFGVDHSPAMLEEARHKVADQPLGCIDLRLGEMAHLPLPDRSVDCVIANMVLHHAADPIAVLCEIRRVLLAEGLLVIADLARHERESARDQLADQWLGFEEDELKGWLYSAGFRSVDFINVDAAEGQESVLIVLSK
jgi:ArsR family transcriptional regulator